MDENTKVTSEESAELARRNQLIAFYRTTVQLLESENNLFVRHLLESKGLDPAKQYELNSDGEFAEVA
jgi:hypothetical protein